MTESVTTRTATAATPHAAQSWGRAAYDAYAEGLYTYCLSVLRDRAAAVSSLRSTFVLADRHIGRLPDLGLLRPWLYALARYECLVRLDGDSPVALAADPASGTPDAPADTGRSPGERRELAALAWPEAVGLAPEQREALELSVRHGLDPSGLAAVLGWEDDHARRVLLQAGHEVDRTRAAVEGASAAASCPDGPGLAAKAAQPAVRDRLVAHVDDCRRCRPHVRLAAARQVPTAGAAANPHALPTIPPPAELRDQVLGDVGRGRSAHRPAELTRRVAEFDRAGFPVFRSRAGRSRAGRRRMTAVAVAVVAIVAAVPAIALWHGAQRGDDAGAREARISAARVTSVEPFDADLSLDLAQRAPGASHGTNAGQRPVPPTAAPAPAAPQPGGRAAAPAAPAAAVPQLAAVAPLVPGAPVLGAGPQAPHPVAPPAAPAAPPATAAPEHPRATAPVVEAAHDRDRTVITLRNTGAVPIDWTADTTAAWLHLSRTAGTLAPGAAETVTVTVDSALAPGGAWSANVRIQPGSSQVVIEGRTDGGEPGATPTPKPTGTDPAPTASPSPTTPGTRPAGKS